MQRLSSRYRDRHVIKGRCGRTTRILLNPPLFSLALSSQQFMHIVSCVGEFRIQFPIADKIFTQTRNKAYAFYIKTADLSFSNSAQCFFFRWIGYTLLSAFKRFSYLYWSALLTNTSSSCWIERHARLTESRSGTATLPSSWIDVHTTHIGSVWAAIRSGDVDAEGIWTTRKFTGCRQSCAFVYI